MPVDLRVDYFDVTERVKKQDLVVENQDLVLVSGGDEVVQNVRVRLQFYRGEWFLDIDEGIPYFESILIKNPDLIEVDRIFKIGILECPEIERIVEYSSNFDIKNRTFNVSFRADSVDGSQIVVDGEEILI